MKDIHYTQAVFNFLILIYATDENPKDFLSNSHVLGIFYTCLQEQVSALTGQPGINGEFDFMFHKSIKVK